MAGRAGQQRDFVILRLPAFPLLLLLLSVCDDVADVLVVHVATNIWGEGGPHILDLREKRREHTDLTHSGWDELGSARLVGSEQESICELYLLLGEPVALSGQQLLEAAKEKQADLNDWLYERWRTRGRASVQFLLDASCTLGVQDLEGAENDVLGVGA